MKTDIGTVIDIDKRYFEDCNAQFFLGMVPLGIPEAGEGTRQLRGPVGYRCRYPKSKRVAVALIAPLYQSVHAGHLMKGQHSSTSRFLTSYARQ